MRTAATVLLLGAALVAAPSLSELEAGTAALLAIGVAVVLAGLACEAFSPLSTGLGALGALAHTALAPVSLPLAGSALMAFVLGARTARARTSPLRGAHLLVSIGTGGVAAWIAARYAGDEVSIQAAAGLVAGLLASAAMLVPVDDVVAHALARLAAEAPDPARAALLRAVALRRRVDGAPEGLSYRTSRRLERAWGTLVDAARARVQATGATAVLLDARIQSHVDALERIHAAADERLARAAGLDDRALTAARLEGEQLEAEVAALAEVGTSSPSSPPPPGEEPRLP
jgi:hypothetical protein